MSWTAPCPACGGETEADAIDAVDAWIAKDGGRCVVYAGAGQWWPAHETHDGPQQIELGVTFTWPELVTWCAAHG